MKNIFAIKFTLLIFCVLINLTTPGKAQKIPNSQLSRKVVLKQTPLLEKEFKEKDLQLGSPVFLRILKKTKKLEVWVKKGDKFHLFKAYKICYFSGGLVHKTKRGDRKSPEGFYYVTPKQLNPYSKFHLAFNIGYPNQYDRAHNYTGSSIMVHGSCRSIGCYAMRDKNIEKIWTIIVKALEGGQPFFRIHIFPFKMTDENIKKQKKEEYIDFWENLKEGYELFEEKRLPPNVNVKNLKYIFNY